MITLTHNTSEPACETFWISQWRDRLREVVALAAENAKLREQLHEQRCRVAYLEGRLGIGTKEETR